MPLINHTQLHGITLRVFEAAGAGEHGRHSVGTTVFGGMIVSTILNLFFIPVLYLIIEGWRERGKSPDVAPASESK